MVFRQALLACRISVVLLVRRNILDSLYNKKNIGHDSGIPHTYFFGFCAF